MSNANVASVHNVLNYLLTKVAVGGKLSKTSIRVPISDLASLVGQVDERDVDLIVKIELFWDEGRGSDMEEVEKASDEQLGEN